MVKGAFTELDRELTKHRLSLREIEEDGVDGRPQAIANILGLMAAYEKMQPRVDEPLEVRGEIRITLTPNTRGDEAYSTCFLALTYNGLVLSGSGDELILVRPETRPGLVLPQRRWDRSYILSTRLFRLGYLNPDPILRRYKDGIGTREGHAVLEPRSNVLIVADSNEALEKLGATIDAEVLEAMGVPASDGQVADGGRRPPSPGATASREGIHFYLLAYARSNRIPLVASEQRVVATKYYPEADIWTSEQGIRALEQEYRRVGESIQLAREAAAQGWVDPQPERTLTPTGQKRLDIRFGLVSPLPGKSNPATTKKAARRR
jgi:hypothetical protein